MSKTDTRTTIAIAVLALGAMPFAKSSATVADITIIVAIYALIALSVGVTYGMCGLLSVAQASLAAIGAYLSAILTNSQGWSPWATLPIAILVPACFAYPFARIVTRLSPLALAIATLMFGYLLDGLLREGGSLTGGYIGLSGIPQIPGAKTPQMYHLISWGLVIVGLIFYARLRASHIGLILRTIRSDSLRAAADGVDVAHFRSLAMSFGAALAGTAGWLYAHDLSYIGPDSLGPSLSLSALLMAVVGGVRSLGGPVLGAALLTLILHFMPGQESLGIFYGAVLILCLLVAPEGLSGLALHLKTLLRNPPKTNTWLIELEALRLKSVPDGEVKK
jgi:branched-chain amino acid transport system permease protein